MLKFGERRKLNLYKFGSAQRTISILGSGRIRFAQLAALNDPFESFPQVESFVTKQFTLQLLDTVLSQEDLLNTVVDETYKRMYEHLPIVQREVVTFENFREFAEKVIHAEMASRGTTLANLFRSTIEANSDVLITTIKQNSIVTIANSICVLSLSAVNSNQLMWAHYADSYRGAAIGFDSQHAFFSKAIQVQYRTERPEIDLGSIPESEEGKRKLAETILATKNISWQYEEEYRLVNAIPMLEETPAKDSAGFTVFVGAFPSEAIREVLLGYRIDRDHEKAIVELLANKYPSARLRRGVLNKESYEVTFKDL
jgi:hypothetical protein